MPEVGLSQHELVVHGIQTKISEGVWGPGDRLPVEADLAEQLGVSRGSLREGVRALVAMGVLETRQGSGTTVTSLAPDLLLRPLLFWASLQAGPEAQHVHVVRRALEVESAGIAAGLVTDDQIDELEAILTEALPHIEAHDHEAAMKLDLAFHLSIADITDNPVLLALIDTLSQPTVRTRMWQSIHAAGRLETAHTEHLAILDALKRRDVVGARAAMQVHLIQATAHLGHTAP